MQRAPVDGIELEYEIRGTGEPVVLIHAGVCAEFFRPLADPLAARHTVLRYHRAGSADSDHVEGAAELLGAGRALPGAHAPRRHRAGARRRALVEREHGAPARARRPGRRPVARAHGHGAPGGAESDAAAVRADRRRAGPRALHRRRHRHRRRHLDARRLRSGLPRRARARVARRDGSGAGRRRHVLRPGAACRDGLDVRAQGGGALRQPALVVTGANSIATFHQRGRLLLEWLPNAEPYELPDATHLLQVENPGALAEALTGFFARHPVATTAPA